MVSLKDVLGSGAIAGVGLLALFIVLIEMLFYLALLVVVFGGAYWLLQHFGILMLTPVAALA